MIITIDGPAGTGKTTVARQVAERLGFDYFDTGAMYRAITYLILKKNIHIQDKRELAPFLSNFRFNIRKENGKIGYFVDGEDVTDVIRSVEVTNRVSEVAANPDIRRSLLEIQRRFGHEKNAVFEGRDMGTVVFPDAEVKIFLTARPEVRAERRYFELRGKEAAVSKEKVFKEILNRDYLDSTREVAPLKQAEDAHLVDTSDLTVEEVVSVVVSLVDS